MEQQAEQVLSLRLSRVLAGIGVNRYMIARRRRTWLMKETMMTICSELEGRNNKFYHFGSQSEGTTTPGMKSDVDLLLCLKPMSVKLDLDERQQKKLQLQVVKTVELPPQHCWLKWGYGDRKFPKTHVNLLPRDVIYNDGTVLQTNLQVEANDIIKQFSSAGEVVEHGPSRSWDEDDFVLAYHCGSLPKECQFLFHRPRPGHWPRTDTMAKARQTGVFLVPHGYMEVPLTKCRSTTLHITQNDPNYPQSKWEWRFSTSMMERLLVFDMSIVQYKTYVFMKILRKTFLKPIVDDRLSTFHMKTAMLFTIETYPPDIWREENLVQCVMYCLTTLRRWLKLKHCPHYTIARVNLFTGKLFKHELRNLSAMLSSLILSNMPYLSQIDIDSIGVKMLRISRGIVCESKEGKQNKQLILKELNKKYNESIAAAFPDAITDSSLIEWEKPEPLITEPLNTLQEISQHGTNLEREVATVVMPLWYGSLASLRALRCIRLKQSITQDILHQYDQSFESDLLSSRLKKASMLYYNRQYDTAADFLIKCEELLVPEVWQSCSCIGRHHTGPNSEFLDKAEHSSNENMLQKFTAICVHFMPQEMCFAPKHLVYEQFRTVGHEDRQQRKPKCEYNWMDLAVIDCVPFLYYMQYLTYRQLKMHDRKDAAKEKLYQYINANSKGHGHIDTALNMLGNCYELENRLDCAWKCYLNSLEFYPRNNSAIWHVARIVHQQVTS